MFKRLKYQLKWFKSSRRWTDLDGVVPVQVNSTLLVALRQGITGSIETVQLTPRLEGCYDLMLTVNLKPSVDLLNTEPVQRALFAGADLVSELSVYGDLSEEVHRACERYKRCMKEVSQAEQTGFKEHDVTDGRPESDS